MRNNISKEVFINRVRRFQELLKRRNIDAAMIRTLSSFIYFTGTKWLRPSILIPADGDPIVFLADGEEDGFKERSWISNIITYKEGGEVMAKVSSLIRNEDYRTIGIEYGIERDAYIIFYEMFKRLNPRVNIVDVSDITYDLRMIKDDFELDRIRKAGEIASKVMNRLLNEIDIGLSETDIAAKAYEYLYKSGSENPHVYVNIGPHPRIHSEPFRDILVRKNIFVTIVLGADYDHYYVNMTRTVFIGKNDFAERALKCVEEAYNTAVEITRVGVKPMTVMKKLDKIYEKYGMLKYAVKGYLHGVGLQIEEVPITTILPKHRSIELKPNMVISFIHAPLMIQGLGQVKKEDTFILTKDNELETVTK